MSAVLDSIIERARHVRHDLHAHPELRFEEVRTAGVVRDELERLGIPWEPCAGTGTLARLAIGAPGSHLAFRADLDALPVEEKTGLPYASRHSGRMHACGHDGHTATLLATAAWFKAHEARLPGPVTLVFQPGEEGGHGAKQMIEQGALAGVDAIYGFHNWPPIPAGRAACVDGPIMAANGNFRALVHGRGGHASQPESCIDPILALSHFVAQVQHVVSRRVAPQRAAVVTVGAFHAGTANNIIPDTAECIGTVRASTSEQLLEISERCSAVLRGVCEASGAEGEWTWTPDYPATLNHPTSAERARAAVRKVLGPNALWTEGLPVMAAEDFSYFAQAIPGCYLLLGSGHPNRVLEPCHSPRFDFDDGLIPVGVRLWSEVAGL